MGPVIKWPHMYDRDRDQEKTSSIRCMARRIYSYLPSNHEDPKVEAGDWDPKQNTGQIFYGVWVKVTCGPDLMINI